MRGSQRPSQALPLTVKRTSTICVMLLLIVLSSCRRAAARRTARSVRTCVNCRRYAADACRSDSGSTASAAASAACAMASSPSPAARGSARPRASRSECDDTPAVAMRARAQRSAVAHDHGRDGRDGEIAVPAGELLDGAAGAGRHHRQAHLDENFIGREARGHGVAKQLGCRNGALALWPAHDDLAVEGLQHHRKFGGRVGIGDRTADRAARARRQMAHELDGLRGAAAACRRRRREFDRALPRHRADANVFAFVLDIGQARECG